MDIGRELETDDERDLCAIDQVRAGNPDAFAEIVTSYTPPSSTPSPSGCSEEIAKRPRKRFKKSSLGYTAPSHGSTHASASLLGSTR